MLTPENWKTPQNILVVLAHPDDPEFFCGATLARWAADGHHISYCLLTCGDKGVRDRHSAPADLCAIRQVEQRAAASILGVEKVDFLAYSDGYIVPDLKLRRDIVRAIRLARPEVVVTSDPTNLFVGDAYINHPDHRYAGQAVLDAVFPAAGNHLFFEELISDEGIEPHGPREVWVTLTSQPTVVLDVTDFWETKICALYEHASQIGDREKFTQRMRSRRTPDSTDEAPRYEEKFRRIIFT